MISLKGYRLILFVSLFLFSDLSMQAQASRVNGSISGTVTAPGDVLVSGADILMTGADGLVHTTHSADDGRFAIRDLPSGNYQITATAAGFAPYNNAGITIAVGRNAQLTVSLHLVGMKEAVSVSAAQNSIDPYQTSSVVNIDRDRVEELPIPSRNYLTFVLLAPQIAPANPAIAQQTQSRADGGFSFGGIRPSSNAVYIDGVDDDDDYTGSSRTELSPEAISDFQIVNHGFAAESGGAAGGSVDVQTRSGANLQHGDAFIFVQNGALNAAPPLENTRHKPDEDRIRTGLSTGGAIKRANIFYYLAGEQEYARGEDANELSEGTIGRINQALQQVGPLKSLMLQDGFVPTIEQETELSGRVDHALTPRQSLMLRYAFTNNRNVNDAFNTDSLSDKSARGSAFVSDNSLNGTFSSTFSERMLNRVSFEVAQRRAVERTDYSRGPGVVIVGLAKFGTPYRGNSRRFETHFSIENGFLQQRGRHLFQLGGGINHVAERVEQLDGSHGLYVFRDPQSLASGKADFYTQSFGNSSSNFSEIRTSAYAQDHWTPLHGLAIDYGLRYEYNKLPAGLPQDAVNFSPRFSIAYSPAASWVIRSGFGIFYDRYQLSTINRLLQFDGKNALVQVAETSAAASLYQSGTQFSYPVPGIAPSIWRPQHGLANPYSEVASLGAEHSLPQNWTAKAEYQFVRGVKLGRSSNVNLGLPIALTPENTAFLGVASPTPQQISRLVFPAARPDSVHDAINQFASEASSNYNGATVTLNRQFDEQFELMAGYTYSKTIDDASFDLEPPENPYAPAAERALSLQDQRHRLTISGLWVLGPDLDDPKGPTAARSPGRFMRAVTGLEIAPIFTAASGYRANPVTGFDSNLEHVYPFAARPHGLGRNSLQTSPNIDFDLRLLKMVPIWRGHLDIVAESFNLLNHTNEALLNTAYGPNSSPQAEFGRPIAASTARRAQFSLDFEY